MRLRSASMATGAYVPQKKDVLQSGERCARRCFRNHAKVLLWNGLRLLRRKSGPLPGPLPKLRVAKRMDFQLLTEAGAGKQGRFLRPAVAPVPQTRTRSRQRVLSKMGRPYHPEESRRVRERGILSGTRRSLSPALSAREKCARDVSRKAAEPRGATAGRKSSSRRGAAIQIAPDPLYVALAVRKTQYCERTGGCDAHKCKARDTENVTT